jgi:plasmid stability protein
VVVEATNPEQKPVMTLTIQLPPEVEKKLRDRAAQSGLAADAYARKLIEQGLHGSPEVPAAGQPAVDPGTGTTLDEILAPLREEFEQSGMTEEELTQFLTEVRDEVRRENRARKVP